MSTKSASSATVTTTELERKANTDPRFLMRSVLAGLRLRHDLSFNAWCRKNRLDRDAVRAAVLGLTNNGRAKQLRGRVIRAAGLTEGESDVP